MTQDEIIRMARESGIKESDVVVFGHFPFEFYQLERFAALVAAHEREKCFDAAMKAAEKAVDTAMLLEREACAKVCEEMIASVITKPMPLRDIVTAIRARGEK